MIITAILPISRIQYLDRVIESLVNQTVKPNYLLVVFDGSENEYVLARNKIIELDYEGVRFVKSNSIAVAHSIPDRRRHITNIHNQIREIIQDSDYIFSIEDDGILPPQALEKLIKSMKDDVGLVTGVELGRWGTRYVGAWTVDNIAEPKQVTSVENKTYDDFVEEIDACGLYCALIKADLYKSHDFFTNNGLGPDVNLGLYIRQQGYKVLIDWSIHVTHLTFRGHDQIEIKATDESRVISLTLLSGSTWKY